MEKGLRKIKPAKRLRGTIAIPADKSISHRAVMIASIAEGTSRIKNFLNAEDCIATIGAFRKMGVDIRSEGNSLEISGAGLKGLKGPSSAIYLGNSGTSMRLLLGILAGQGFQAVLSGDDSLSKRPMKRVTAPLRNMGAGITGGDDANFAPLTVRGGKLRGIDYVSPIASAQVKSSVLFAGLYAEGVTSVTEPFKSRDHTERMLGLFGADISSNRLKTSIRSGERLRKNDIYIPGDISSAAFFIVAALLLQGSDITIRDVGVNDTRTGILDILKAMGAKIEKRNPRGDWEPVCDIAVRSSELKAASIEKSDIPRLIDELPVLMTAAVFARGRTIMRGVGELRVKETDRINSMLYNLRKMGARIEAKGDDVSIEGTGSLQGSEELLSFGDHRTAMAVSVAALCARGISAVDDIRCVNTSFPGFFDIMESVSLY